MKPSGQEVQVVEFSCLGDCIVFLRVAERLIHNTFDAFFGQVQKNKGSDNH